MQEETRAKLLQIAADLAIALMQDKQEERMAKVIETAELDSSADPIDVMNAIYDHLCTKFEKQQSP